MLLLDDVNGGVEVKSLGNEGVTLGEEVLQLLSELEKLIILRLKEVLSIRKLGLKVKVI